jgi:hypothetical protein
VADGATRDLGHQGRRGSDLVAAGPTRLALVAVSGTLGAVLSASVTPPDERHYRRQATDYVRPASPLRLDGTMSWDAKTGWENEEVLHGMPLGAEVIVEAVTEPGNPHDHTALALDVDGIRVGYMPAGFSARLSGKDHRPPTEHHATDYDDVQCLLRGSSPVSGNAGQYGNTPAVSSPSTSIRAAPTT